MTQKINPIITLLIKSSLEQSALVENIWHNHSLIAWKDNLNIHLVVLTVPFFHHLRDQYSGILS